MPETPSIVGRILEQVEAIDVYLARQSAQRVKIATDPLYDLFERVMEGEVGTFEISEANMALLSRHDGRWFPIVANAMETPDAKSRDLRLYRICELAVGTNVVGHELVGDVLHAWLLRMVLDSAKISRWLNGDLQYGRTSRNYGLDFELDLARWECLPVEDFMGPRPEIRRKTVQIQHFNDVPGDFAWSAEVLSRKYDALVRSLRVSGES